MPLRVGEKTSNSKRALQSSDAHRTQTSSVGSQGSWDPIRESPSLCLVSEQPEHVYPVPFYSLDALKGNSVWLTHLPHCYERVTTESPELALGQEEDHSEQTKAHFTCSILVSALLRA